MINKEGDEQEQLNKEDYVTNMSKLIYDIRRKDR